MSERGVEMVQSTWCPNGDGHVLRRESFVPPRSGTPPEGLIVYVLDCATCKRMQYVNVTQRWRVLGDQTRTLYRTEEEALRVAGLSQTANSALLE